MTGGARLPAAMRWAVWLLAAEAVAGLVVTGLLAYLGATEADDLTRGLAVAGYVGLMTAALAGVAVALGRRKPRARAPAIVLQLLGVVVAYFLTTVGLLWLSIPVAAASLLITALLLAPATTGALTS